MVTIRRRSKIWYLFSSLSFIIVFVLNYGCGQGKVSKTGLYQSSFPNISIELQNNGNVFVTPKEGNRIYCSTNGSWSESGEKKLFLELNIQEGCEWVSDLSGIWELSECNTFEGNKTYCLQKGSYKFIKN